MLSPPGATIYVAPSSPMLHRPSTSLYPYFLPRPMCLCRLSIRFCNLLELSDVLHPLYRLSPFHPLAKYPGPTIAKASKLWGSYHSATGNIHRCYKSLHERFGDVVRVGKYLRRMVLPLRVKMYGRSPSFIGPNELSIRDSSLIHPVLGKGGLPKGPRAYMVSRMLSI